MHALALAQLLGDSAPQRLTDLRTRLDRVEKSPTQPSIAATLADLPPGSRAEQFVDFYFLRLLNQQLPPAVWQEPTLVSRALTVSDHGDRAAVSGDERGENWSLPLVAAGNRARRTAIDQMLLGDDAALAASTQAWDEAERRCSQADSLAKKVAEAIALRDRTWGEVPYLVRWLARPLTADAPPEAAAALDSEINSSLLPLIRAAHALDATLAAGPASETQSADAPVFEQQAGEVQQQLAHLEELFTKDCGRLEELKKGDAQTLRQVDAALALPLVPAAQRETLRKLSGQFSAQLDAQEASGAGAKSSASVGGKSPATGDAAPESAPYLERRLVRWQEHPALAILADDASDVATSPTGTTTGPTKTKATTSAKSVSDLPAAMVDLERRLRERLEGLPGTLDRLRDAGTGDAEGSPHTGRGDDLARAQAVRHSGGAVGSGGGSDRSAAAGRRPDPAPPTVGRAATAAVALPAGAGRFLGTRGRAGATALRRRRGRLSARHAVGRRSRRGRASGSQPAGEIARSAAAGGRRRLANDSGRRAAS